MATLPLFPLNTVLFPGMQLKLHIFEERYKLMINSCIESNQPFGVVLIKEGREAFDPIAIPSAPSVALRRSAMCNVFRWAG